MSGTCHKMIQVNAGRLEMMGRRYGIPLLKLANHINAPRIVGHIADAVSDPSKDSLSKRLTYGGKTKKDGEFVEIHNYSNNFSHKKRVEETAKRRVSNKKNFLYAMSDHTPLFDVMGGLEQK